MWRASRISKRADTDPALLYPEHNISVPVDHFPHDDSYAPHSSDKFNLRYWFDASHYKKGGPIIILEGGETSGAGRLTFLQKGILAQLVQATNGIGVVIEHRYYGTSFPVPDLSTKNLRFLTHEQAMADVAYFAKNVKFPGMENTDLTAPKNPYIVYGGSYAGAFVAFLRVKYPDIFWGAISSSGVTKAIWDYWEYYDIIRQFAPKECSVTTQKLTNVVDNILIGKKDDEDLMMRLKEAFLLPNVTVTGDFTSALSSGLGAWQSRNWDPALNSKRSDYYCGNVSSDTVLWPGTEALRSTASDLIEEGGWGNETDGLTTRMLNYIGWLNYTIVAPCTASGSTQNACFNYSDPNYYAQDDIDQWSWRSWAYQYCSQWGYLQTGSGSPPNILPVISRTIDIPYSSIPCVAGFNITTPPNTHAVNKYGGFHIAYDRLAIIDGEADPWRGATPHADQAPKRRSTTNRPYELITGLAVHHWDENGLFPNQTTADLPPAPVKAAQKSEREFVQAWLEEWKDCH
jgi:hypothetical protein